MVGEFIMNRTILITGAAGFIGFHLAKKLLDEGDRIIGYDNINDYYDPELKKTRIHILEKYTNFVFVKADLTDKTELERVFIEYIPRIVVNLAAQAGVRYSIEHPDSYIQSNLVGFANLIECCRHFDVKHFVFASSSSIYGNSEKIPFSVLDRTDEPVSLYAATKKSNELIAYAYCHLYGLPCTGLRFFTVYGPYGRPDMAYFSFTKAIYAGESIKIYNGGDLYRDFTYIDDVILGINGVLGQSEALCKKENPYKIYNIGNHSPEKLMDFIHYLESAIGIEAKKEYYPMQPGDVYQTYADVSDLERDVHFCPDTSLEEGICRFVDWYKEFYHC